MDYWTIGFSLLAISLAALVAWAVLRYGADDAPPKFDLAKRLEQFEVVPPRLRETAPYKVEPAPPTKRPHVRAVSVPKSSGAMKVRRKRRA